VNTMSIEPPKSSQEALHQAILEIGNLRKRMPGAKSGEVLSVFDKVEEVWSKQDMEQFPFNILAKEINTIKIEMRETYGDGLDLEVGRRSPIFDQVVDLDHRIRIYSELVAFNPIYSGLDKRLQRLDGVLPPRNYSLKDLLSDLRPSFDPSLRKRLETALGHFEREEYETSIAECGKAEGILFSHFRKLLAGFEIIGLSTSTGPALRQICKMLESRQDGDGFSLSKSGRLELFVLSMFETLHYLRNLGAHDRAEEVVEEKLPNWQVRWRELFTQKPEYARLALALTIQIATELQVLIDHQVP
jgi:hypothetical protein